MKKMNKKGFTLVELLAVIVILAILMAIAATNIGPVIDNSRRSSMRTTAQMILDAVQTQLTANYELYPGTYQFTTAIIDKGGVSAPFGGKYKYLETEPTDIDKIGSGVFRVNASPTSVVDDDGNPSRANCDTSKISFVSVDRNNATSNYTYSICLTTDETTNGGTFLAGTRAQVDDSSNERIFFGRADTKGLNPTNP